MGRLTQAGVNKIILLSHSGFDIDLDIARQTTGVDVIVGGHSNNYLSNSSDKAKGAYPTMIGGTAIVQAYAYGKFLGVLKVMFDDDGRLVSAMGEPLLLDKHVAEDKAIVARLAVLAKPLDEIRNKIVARIAAPINGDRKICRVQECEMGNLVAEAMLDRVADLGVAIAIANSGRLRTSIEARDVTMGDVLTVLPFQNTLSTFKVTGQTVIDALENGVSQIEEVKGRFPQVAGLRFSFDMSIAPNKGRISSVMVMQDGRWQAIDPSALYYLVSNNYVRGGGDGYRMFGNAQDVYDFGPDLADVVADYLAKRPDYTAFTDGRITQK